MPQATDPSDCIFNPSSTVIQEKMSLRGRGLVFEMRNVLDVLSRGCETKQFYCSTCLVT